MFCDLHKYAELTIRYLLLFTAEINDQCCKHMVVDFLEDTGMACFLSGCRTGQVLHPLPINAGQSMSESQSCIPRNSINYTLADRTRSNFRVICGSNRPDHKNYIDIVQGGRDMMLEIINVPLPESLFHKIMYSSDKNIPEFTFDDMCLITMHLFPLQDKAGIIVYGMCAHLQKNLDLVWRLKMCGDRASKNNRSDKLQRLAEVVFDASGSTNSFRQLVNSNIAFAIKDGLNETAETIAKDNLSGHLCYSVDLNELSIGFLVKNLIMTCSYLMNNEYILVEKFFARANGFSLDVQVTAIGMSLEKTFISNEMLTYQLIFLSQCGFLSSKNIANVTLVFDRVMSWFYPPHFFYIENLSGVICDSCAIGFINSMPKHVRNVKAVLVNQSMEMIDFFFRGLLYLKYANYVFSIDFVFPCHTRTVKILDSAIKKGANLSFNEECEHILVSNTTGSIYLSSITGLNEVVFKEHHEALFELCTSKGLLTIRHAYVEGAVCFCTKASKITLDHVQLFPDSEMLFFNENEHISISECEGLMDLTPYIGTGLYLLKHMKIRVIPIRNTSLNNTELCNINIYTSIELGSKNRSVTLRNIITEGRAQVVISGACNEIEIHTCSCSIDVRKVKSFHRIMICFAENESGTVDFVGEVVVSKLDVRNVYRNLHKIALLLIRFKKIKHLQFKSEYGVEYCEKSKRSTYVAELFAPRKKAAGGNTAASPGRSRTKRRGAQSSVSAKSNTAANKELGVMLSATATNSIKRLDLTFDVITRHCYRHFNKLLNLEILKVVVQNISGEFFDSLPRTIKMLDISETLRHDKNRLPCCQVRHSYPKSMLNMLGVLVIDEIFLPYISRISHLMPALRILKICFTDELLPGFPVPFGKKLQVRSLIVEITEKLTCYPNIAVLEIYCSSLSRYIDFESLRTFVFISSDECIQICPSSRKILSREQRSTH